MQPSPAMDRIVVSTDFSPSARAALDYAAGLADRLGADLHLFHVVAWPDPDAYGLTAPQAQREMWAGSLTERARHLLAQEADRTGLARVTVVVREDASIAQAVLDYADEVAASLIVTGTHGRRGVGRLVLGSIADRIVRTAPTDVILVPSAPGHSFSGRKVGRVLVPVDLSDASPHLLAVARRLARRLHAEGLDMLHVIEPMPYPVRWLDETLLDVYPAFRDRAAADLRALAGDPVDDEHVEGLYIERGGAVRTIGQVAASLGTELIVMCDKSGSAVREDLEDRMGPLVRPMLGTTAEGVARSAPCPVLIARRSVAETRALASAHASVLPHTPA
jgi:nucleotide-binding universal stress UspA family protein